MSFHGTLDLERQAQAFSPLPGCDARWAAGPDGVFDTADDVVYSLAMDPALIREYHIIIMMDPPEHDRLRALVSRVFTPRAVTALMEAVTGRAFAKASGVREAALRGLAAVADNRLAVRFNFKLVAK